MHFEEWEKNERVRASEAAAAYFEPVGIGRGRTGWGLLQWTEYRVTIQLGDCFLARSAINSCCRASSICLIYNCPSRVGRQRNNQNKVIM